MSTEASSGPRQMHWFRFYTETVEDRKLRRLPPAQRWLWVACMATARKSPVPGHLLLAGNVAVTFHDLADIAALDLTEVQAGMAAFIAQDMVREEEGVYFLVNWGKRQFVSDDVTARVQEWRARRKAEREAQEAAGNVAEPPSIKEGAKRSGNVARNVAVTPQSTETETEYLSPNGDRDAARQNALPLAVPKPKKEAAAKHPAVNVYCRLSGAKSPLPVIRTAIEEAIDATDEAALTLWGQCVTAWMKAGYSQRNVSGMLDWFAQGGPPAREAARRNGKVPDPEPFHRPIPDYDAITPVRCPPEYLSKSRHPAGREDVP